MIPETTISDLHTRGVILSANGGQLHVEAPKGVMTPSLRDWLKAHKGKLLEALKAANADLEAVEDLHEHFEERAAILEYDADLLRDQAELEAARMAATVARNKGYTWASLRLALEGYPALLEQLPEGEGVVDGLPLGLAKVAVLPSGQAVVQGGLQSRRTSTHEDAEAQESQPAPEDAAPGEAGR